MIMAIFPLHTTCYDNLSEEVIFLYLLRNIRKHANNKTRMNRIHYIYHYQIHLRFDSCHFFLHFASCNNLPESIVWKLMSKQLKYEIKRDFIRYVMHAKTKSIVYISTRTIRTRIRQMHLAPVHDCILVNIDLKFLHQRRVYSRNLNSREVSII